MSVASNTSKESDRLALRAELNKLKPGFMSQADWDEEMDRQDKQDEVTLAALIKSGEQYNLDHPDETPTPATDEDTRTQSAEEVLAAHGVELDPITPVA